MNKKITLTFFFFLVAILAVNAQKELWGVNTGQEYFNAASPGYYGNIVKYDMNGENPAIVHQFDSIHGYIPMGKLFLASNGKLYGTTKKGGNLYSNFGGTNNQSCGVLFEYDLILDSYRVVHYFQYDTDFKINPEIGVIEPVTGRLYGATAEHIYKYDITTETTTVYNKVGYFNSIHGELMKASDGNLYGTSYYYQCPNTSFNQPWNGCIIKFNTGTNTLSIVHQIECDPHLEGLAPWRQLVETTPGKLMGMTKDGGLFTNIAGQAVPAGTLFELNIATNAFSKKVDFNKNTVGAIPIDFTTGADGKFYGISQTGGAAQSCNPGNNMGTLYEYVPGSGVQVKQYFNYCGNAVSYPSSLLRTSDGSLIGTIPNGGLFKYDPASNTIAMPTYTSSDTNLYNAANLIEICRKPSYRYFDTDTYTICKNNPFTFDVHNTNATGYVWKKGGAVVPGQTTGILTFASLQLTDTGDYTCEMTNECGITVTMPLHLIVDGCLGLDEAIGRKNAIALYPNPASTALHIELPETQNFAIERITVNNMLGQKVLDVATDETTIDVNSLKNGVYILEMKTDKGDWNAKFIKK